MCVSAISCWFAAISITVSKQSLFNMQAQYAVIRIVLPSLNTMSYEMGAALVDAFM
jgi:hypothetical protein